MKRIIINKKLVADEIRRFLGPVDLSDEVLSKLFKIATIDKVKKHNIILAPGAHCDYLGLVLKGMIQIYHYLDNKLVSFLCGRGMRILRCGQFLDRCPFGSDHRGFGAFRYRKIRQNSILPVMQRGSENRPDLSQDPSVWHHHVK